MTDERQEREQLVLFKYVFGTYDAVSSDQTRDLPIEKNNIICYWVNCVKINNLNNGYDIGI